MSLTPRQMAKNLLKGESLPRPLLLPIVFSLGAKVENIPLEAFLNNPTKITSALRQMRNHLRTDGVVCYFDAYLEVEALGGTVQRTSADEAAVIQWPHPMETGEISDGLPSPEEAVGNGRIPVAAEVIRRMNALPNREFLLMACVTGPALLANGILQQHPRTDAATGHISGQAMEIAASMVTQTVTTFLEAGADLIVIWEQMPAELSSGHYDEWKNFLIPSINVTRFYEALPVLQFVDASPTIEIWDSILSQQWECVLCVPASMPSSFRPKGSSGITATQTGVALPPEVFLPDEAGAENTPSKLREAVSQLHPALITTVDDVPFTTDMKHLKKVLDEIAR